MENGAFSPKEQMLHFPYYFQIHDISSFSFSEIYKIVSQKQIDDENSPSNSEQTITVTPTGNSQSSKRPCCSV